MDIKKIYTENGKVIKEYFVHKEDAKEVASKLGIGDDLVETLENIFATDEFIVVEEDNSISLSKDGKMVGFNIISGYLNSTNANSKSIAVGTENTSPINTETMEGTVNTSSVDITQKDWSKFGKVEEKDENLDENLDEN